MGEDDADCKDESVRLFREAFADGAKLDAREGEDVLTEGGGELALSGLVLDGFRSEQNICAILMGK